MKFPILVIAYAFIQMSSCTLSDVPAEELAQTKTMVSTDAYPTLDSDSSTEAIDNIPATASSLIPESDDSSQDGNEITTSSSLHSAAFVKVTWSPLSSMLLSTESMTVQNTEHFKTNAFQTPPSIFENLDHENELDTENRMTDMSKSPRTTMSVSPLLYSHKVSSNTERTTDGPSYSQGSVDYSLSESENEHTSETTTQSEESLQHNMENTTSIPISLASDHATVETSFSDSETDYPNTELVAESQKVSSILTRDEIVMSNSSIFVSTESTSESLGRSNLRETENMENETFTPEGIKSLNDDNSKSSTSSITKENTENMEESSLHYTSVVPNSSFTESTKNNEPDDTLSFSEKNDENLELTSRLNLETTTASFFYLSEKSNEMLSSTTTDVSKAIETDNLPIFKANVTAPLSLDQSSVTISTINDESFSQTSSDLKSMEESRTTTIVEHTDSPISYTISTKSSDEENLSISTLISNMPTTADDSVPTTSETVVSSDPQLSSAGALAGAEESNESKTASSISENAEMEETTQTPIPTTLLDKDMSQTTTSSLEVDMSTKYDVSAFANDEKEASKFLTSEKSDLSEITYHSNVMTEQYFPSTEAINDVDESNTVTYSPTYTNIEIEGSTYSATEMSSASQTVPNNLLPETNITQLPTSVSSDAVELNYSTIPFLPTHEDTVRDDTTETFTEESTVPQTVSYPLTSTVFDPKLSSSIYNALSTLKPIQDFSTEETSTSKSESYTIEDEISTSLPDSYSSSVDVVSTDISIIPSETHREGKHLPFSTTSTLKVTDISSEYGYLYVTTEKTPKMKAAVNDTEVHYMQIKIEDLNPNDRTNIITAVIKFPADSVQKAEMKTKLARTHQWLDKVLTKEFRNWTGDPFQKDEDDDDVIPFGNISIFYVKPTPETNASHITLTFIVYNFWRNRTLPVDFVPGTLNFYSKELKESINASAIYFYQGLSTENYDLLSAVFDKYGIMIFTICLAVVGITILVCIVVFYRKKTRQSIHYLADSKLQQNLQEAVGIDLTPASIILQDEKEEKGSKICDDEGWLVPITDVPVAEENGVPNIQDTKL